jgi:hypothetical protein
MQAFKTLTAKHNLILLFMVVLPLVSLFTLIMWILHTPDPSVKTMVAIDSNSLLPHRYAGPCLNCHQILPGAPTAMNRANMHAFRLTDVERQLLMAGQSVEVPTLRQKLSIPAITRSDILPHRYVGVCTNCHLVLDVRPTPGYMQEAMRRATQHLLKSDLTAVGVAWGGFAADHRHSLTRRLWGYTAIPLFVLAAVYVVLRQIVRLNPTAYQGRFPLDGWLVVHQWCAVGFTAAATMHGYYSDRGNNFLHLAFVAAVSLTLIGAALRYLAISDGPGRATLLLHTQRALFMGLLAVGIIGHFFADFR